LFVMVDEAVLGIHRFDLAATMALAAQFSVTNDLHTEPARVGGMQAAGSMAGLALDARFGPGADDAGAVVLAALWAVARGVAGAAVILQLGRARFILHPTGFLADDGVGEIVLVEIFRIADHRARLVGDDVALLVHEARLPVITADDVADIVPGVPFGRVGNFCERILRWLSIDHRVELPGVARFHERVI
jgi:hypothetical protein